MALVRRATAFPLFVVLMQRGSKPLFKELGNFAGLMRQAQELGNKFQGINDRLKSERLVGSAGGGMVEAEVNGVGEVLRVTIEPSLVATGDREMIEDLLPAALNQALGKAKERHAEVMKEMTADINVPGLNEAIGKLTGEQPPD